jgi:hypothetical protein
MKIPILNVVAVTAQAGQDEASQNNVTEGSLQPGEHLASQRQTGGS